MIDEILYWVTVWRNKKFRESEDQLFNISAF